MASLILAFLFLWFFFDFHVALGTVLAGWFILAVVINFFNLILSK